ncbi:lipopolysaccharide biosynthesis protein [Ensifer soli]|uniref:lipopolysaccharide biosynthesis protein n=1 Tax=Ciceribacter sp. sgz301302 TaxID=3342379 RepID=UPI0035BA64F4
MAVFQSAERILPAVMRARLSPVLRKLPALIRSSDPRHLAQRMALVAFAIRVVSAAIAFVSQIILARMMGGFEYGIFVFVWVLAVLFGNLSCLGFHSAIIRFLPLYHARDAVAEIRGLTTATRIFALVSATGLMVVGLAALHLLAPLIEAYYVAPLFLALFCLPMVALGDIMEGTARAHSWPVQALSPTYIIRPVLILVLMVLAVSLGEPHTAATAMAAALGATYLTTVTQFLILTRRLERRYEQGPRSLEFALWLKAAVPIFVVEAFGFLLTNSDTVVVGLYLEPDRVGVYFAAAKTMALVHFVMFSVKAAVAPRFSAAMADPDRRQLAVIAVESARWTFWPSLGVGLSVLAAGPFLLSLFGPDFTEGYVVMVILFAGIMAKALVGPGEAFLTMAGHQNLCVPLYAVALAVNIALNMVLIPRFGLEGAAAAGAGALMVEAILLHLAVRHTFGIVLFAFANPNAMARTTEAGPR